MHVNLICSIMDDFSFLITSCATRTHTHIYEIIYNLALRVFHESIFKMLHVLISWVATCPDYVVSLFFFFLIMSQNCQSLHLAPDCELVKNKCVVGLKDRPPPLLPHTDIWLKSSGSVLPSCVTLRPGQRSKGTSERRFLHTLAQMLDLNQKALRHNRLKNVDFFSSVVVSLVCPLKHDSVSQSQEM